MKYIFLAFAAASLALLVPALHMFGPYGATLALGSFFTSAVAAVALNVL